MGTAGAPNHYFAESPPGKIWDPHQSVRGRNVYCGKAPIWVCFLFLLLFFFFSFLFSWEASMNCWLMKIGRDSYHVHFTDENTEAKKKDTQYVQDQNPVTGRAKTELMYWALKFVLFWVFFFFLIIMFMFLWPSLHFPGQTSSCTSSDTCNRGENLSFFPGYLGIKFIILYLLSSLGVHESYPHQKMLLSVFKSHFSVITFFL